MRRRPPRRQAPSLPAPQARVPAGVLVFCVLLLTTACGRAELPAGPDIEVRLGQLLLDPESHSPVVVLQELDGERLLPIWIGSNEARSIAAARDEERPIRPNTHDLAKRLVDRLDGAVERVVVTHLSEGIYYALIHVRGGDGMLTVDARPSDAIAIALRYSAPLFVRETLFVRARPTDGDLPSGHPPIDDRQVKRQAI